MSILSKPVNFIKEVRVQLTKVSWPTREELLGATVVVIVSILLAATFIGIVDLTFSRILSLIFR